MTVSTITSSITAIGNGATTAFTFPFVGVAATDLEVIYVNSSGSSTTLNPALYSVTLNAVPVGGLWGIGGTVTYPLSGSAIASGTSLTINRIVPFTQSVSINNQGAFYPQAVEQGLDLLELQIQQLDTTDQHTLQFPVTDVNPTVVLPPAASRANGYLAFDASGNPTILTATAPTIPAFTAQTVSNIAALKALGVTSLINNQLYFIRGYYTDGDGGEGFFKLTTVNPGADNGGTIIWATLSGYYFVRQNYGNGAPTAGWFGAVADSTTNDTAALQNAITTCATAGQPLFLVRNSYAVTQVLINGGQQYIDGRNCIITRRSGSGASKSLVDLKSGFNVIKNMFLEAGRATDYDCALHWYTNNLNLYYPGFNRIDGLFLRYAKVGLGIGALPSQYDHAAGVAGLWGIPAQGTVQAAGIATDAPVSESTLSNVITYGCLNPIWMCQPNGKLTLTDSAILGATNEWSGQDNTTVMPLRMRASSTLNITNCSIEQNVATTGRFFDLWDGTQTYVCNSVIESVAPSWLQDNASLTLSLISDFGYNTEDAPFKIDTAWTGNLVISDCALFRTYACDVTPIHSVVESYNGWVQGSSVGAAAPNLFGTVRFSNVDFLVSGIGHGSADQYVPLCSNVKYHVDNCYKVTLDSGTGLPTTKKLMNDGPELFNPGIDITSSVLSAYPVSTTPMGGWTFVQDAGPIGRWGKVTTSLPAIYDEVPTAAIELNSVSNTGIAKITSPKVFVQPSKMYILRSYLKNGNSTTTGFTITAYFWDWAGVACSTASSLLYTGKNNIFGTAWAPTSFEFNIPAGCSQVSIEYKSVDGTNMFILNPSLR